MATVDRILDDLPEPVRQMVRQIWDALPSDKQKDLHRVFHALPSSLKPLKDIFFSVLDQYKPVFGTKRTIAIVGPANVGKSTLYNQLIPRKEDRAQVGPVPGTTRDNQVADTGLFFIVDTPGADAVGAVGERERQIAFQAAEAADFLVIVFEAAHGIKQYERDLFDALAALDKPFVVLLNKIDSIARRDRDLVIESAARNLHLDRSHIIATVATKGINVEQVILAIARFEPELLAAIGAGLPSYRQKLAWQRTVSAAGTAGMVALMPLPLADLIPLIAIQSGLVLSIARVYGFRLTPARAKELMATFGMGLIGRTVFQELSKLGGVPGWMLSAAIATATTVAIGYGAAIWFAYGESPTRETMYHIVTHVSRHVRERLLSLGHKKPDRGTLRKRLTSTLKDLPIPLPSGAESATGKVSPDAESRP
ncbi:MAG: GTPase [Anaerolineae bacterium]